MRERTAFAVGANDRRSFQLTPAFGQIERVCTQHASSKCDAEVLPSQRSDPRQLQCIP